MALVFKVLGAVEPAVLSVRWRGDHQLVCNPNIPRVWREQEEQMEGLGRAKKVGRAGRDVVK